MSSTPSAPADQAAQAPEAATAETTVPTVNPEGVDVAEAAPAQPQDSPAATAARLAELFPALFTGGAKPLKLRIQVDIQERAPGVFSKQALSAYFRRYTGGTSYLMAVSKGTQRFDLDGQPAGELSEEHRKVAADELARRRTNANAKRELEAQQRHNRATLLRDFETTKLTTANFCALKGVPVEALDGLLAQARADALEDAQRPRRPEPGRRDGPPRHEARNGPRAGQGPRRDAPGPRGPRTEGEARPGGRPPRRP